MDSKKDRLCCLMANLYMASTQCEEILSFIAPLKDKELIEEVKGLKHKLQSRYLSTRERYKRQCEIEEEKERMEGSI